MSDKKVIMEVNHLKKYFRLESKRTLKAVDDVSFQVYEGETLGIVGESGCGKTTCGRTCIGVYEATDGEVLYKGKNIHKMNNAEKKEFTKHVQMIFQDPYSSLDPRLKVHDIIAEGMRIHKLVHSKEEEIQAVQNLLEQVGLNPEHPYTKALLSAIPIPDPKVEKAREQIRLEGEVPSPVNSPAGCHFCNPCKYATEKRAQIV